MNSSFVFTRKRFFCPGKGREVEADFLAYRREPGRLLEVKSCAAFHEGEEMDCDRCCLQLPQAVAAPALFPEPLSASVEPMGSYTDEVLAHIVELVDLLDEHAFTYLPDVPFLEMAKPTVLSPASSVQGPEED